MTTAGELRHGYASHALEFGANPSAILEIMGHKSLETTMKYLHADHLSVRSPLETILNSTRNFQTPSKHMTLATFRNDLGGEWLVPPADCAGTGHPPGDGRPVFAVGGFKTGQSAHLGDVLATQWGCTTVCDEIDAP